MTADIHLGSYGVAPWGVMAGCGCGSPTRGFSGLGEIGYCDGCHSGFGATDSDSVKPYLTKQQLTWYDQINSLLANRGNTAAVNKQLIAFRDQIVEAGRLQKEVKELNSKVTQMSKFGAAAASAYVKERTAKQAALAKVAAQAKAGAAAMQLIMKKIQGLEKAAGQAPAMGTDAATGETFLQKYGMLLGLGAVAAAGFFLISRRK